MTTNVFARAFALVAAVLVVGLFEVGCSSHETCVTGSEACVCTAGGGCDPGLRCLSGRCVNPDSSGPRTGGTTGTDALPSGTGGQGTGGAGAPDAPVVGSGGSSVADVGGPRDVAPEAGAGGSGGAAPGGTGGAAGSPMPDAGVDTGPPATPAAGCRELIQTYCARANGECRPAGQAPFEQAGCVAVNEVVLGCERATMSYATCVADTKAVSCASLLTPTGLSLPNSCRDPVNSTPLSEAQMKCQGLGLADCQRSAECQGIVPTAAQLNACLADFFETLLDCSIAVEVRPGYPACLAAIMTLPCTTSTDGGAPDAGGNGTAACTDAIKLYGDP